MCDEGAEGVEGRQEVKSSAAPDVDRPVTHGTSLGLAIYGE